MRSRPQTIVARDRKVIAEVVRRLLTIITLLLFAGRLAAAEKMFVSSAEELRSLGNIKAGSEVVWRNGDYADVVVTINASGTAKKPVIFRAESEGGVRFTGLSRLRIKGKYVIVKGFWWQNPTIEKGVVVSFDKHSSYSRLVECAITGFDCEMRLNCNVKWVSIWGYKNRVEQCSFLDKRDLGQNLIVRIDKGDRPPKAIIRNCHFSRPRSLLNEKGHRINGQCCIRIGTSNVAQQQAECVVERCYFEQCNGEGEVVSSKSCGNTFRNNLFYECRGSLTLRHGNNSQVVANYFIGNGEPLSAGVRIVGEGHTVARNHFEGLQIGAYGSIHMIMGHANASAGGYQQVKEVTIDGNTIVNCRYGISANNARRKECVMPVVDTRVEGNTIVAEDGCCTISCEDADHQIDWAKNTIYGGVQRGISIVESKKKPNIPNIELALRAIRTNAGVSFMNKFITFVPQK